MTDARLKTAVTLSSVVLLDGKLSLAHVNNVFHMSSDHLTQDPHKIGFLTIHFVVLVRIARSFKSQWVAGILKKKKTLALILGAPFYCFCDAHEMQKLCICS